MKRSDGKNRTPSGTQESSAGGSPETGSAAGTAEHSNVLRWVVIGGLVLIVFAAAGTIGTFVRDYKAKQLAPPTSAAGPSALAVAVKATAPITITVYEDMRDPATLQFSQTFDATLDQLIASGTVNIYYREVAGVDAAKGGSGSLNAGNALGCAQDTSNKDFKEFRQVLLANQPAETTDTFGSKSELITLAKQVKGLDSDVFRACVDNGNHNVWVKDSTSAFKALNEGSVPVVQMEVIGQSGPQTVLSSSQALTPAQLTSMVIAAAQTAPTAVASPSPSSS